MTSVAGYPRGKLVGMGHIVVEGQKLDTFFNVELEQGVESIALPEGNTMLSEVNVAMRKNIRGKLGWEDMDASLLAYMIGGTLTDDSGMTMTTERGTVPAVGPYTVTLAHAAHCEDNSVGLGSVVLYDTSGTEIRPEKISGSPAGLGEFAISSGVLTFHSSAAGYTVDVTYAYTDTTGRKIEVSHEASIEPFELYAAVAFSDVKGAISYAVIKARNCVWASPFSLAAPRGSYKNYERDFIINNVAAGDLIIYWDK